MASSGCHARGDGPSDRNNGLSVCKIWFISRLKGRCCQMFSRTVRPPQGQQSKAAAPGSIAVHKEGGRPDRSGILPRRSASRRLRPAHCASGRDRSDPVLRYIARRPATCLRSVIGSTPFAGGNSLVGICRSGLKAKLETWPSGRRRSPAKGVGGKLSRGFESHRLRQRPDESRGRRNSGACAAGSPPINMLPVPCCRVRLSAARK